MDIGRAIYNILSNNTAVASMVGKNISPNIMSQTTNFPFIVYDVTSDNPVGQKDSVATLDVATIMVSAYAESYSDSNKLGLYIRHALDRVNGTYSGVDIQAIDFDGYDDIFDDDSGADGIFRKALNFNVRIINSFTNIYSTDFDGVDDYVAIDGISSVFSATAGAISLWAQIDTTSTTVNLLKAYVDANNSITIFYHASANELKLNYKGSGTANTAVSTAAIEGDGLWHHIVGTWNTAATEIKLYLDGEVAQTTSSMTTFVGSLSAASIGNNADGGGYFLGNIDEVSLYDETITAAQVTSIYDSGFPNSVITQSGLVGWWRMGDGATFPTIPDDSTNSNDGTMTNMASGDIVAETPQ